MQRQHIVRIVIAMLFLAPFSASAEGVNASTGASTTTTVGGAGASGSSHSETHPPLPPKPDNLSWGISNPASMPGKSGMNQGKPTGTSTKGDPKLMMASDTRALPVNLMRKIEERDERGSSTSVKDERPEQRGRMLASGTPKWGGPCSADASSSDCARTKGEMRERIGEHRGEIFKHASEMMKKRLHAALERFNKLADRIDSRIDKMKAAGSDTAGAEAKMTIVRKRLEEARTAVDGVDAAIESVAASLENGTSSTPSSDEKKPAKDAMEKARNALLSVMQALNDVMPTLRTGGSLKGSLNASTTSDASGTPSLPGGFMRTKDRPMSTSSDGRPDPTL